MKRKFNEFLIMGLTGTIIFGSFFTGEHLQATAGNKDIWWTPMSMARSLDQTGTEFELYLKGSMLQKHIDKGTLLTVDDKGKSSKVAQDDIKVRLNNWHRIKAEKLNYAVITAFFLGVSIALLSIGLVRFFANKKENGKRA